MLAQLHLSMVQSSLGATGVPIYGGTQGGLFVWVYVGEFLLEKTFAAERDLARYLMEEVNLGCTES